MKYALNRQNIVAPEAEHSLPNVVDFAPPSDFEPVSKHGDLPSAEIPSNSELEPKQDWWTLIKTEWIDTGKFKL
jgi:hypothetical protein